MIALALAGLCGAARAETRPPYGGRVTATLLGEPVHLDPVRARTHAELTVCGLLFDTLYQIGGRDARGQVEIAPHLAVALPAPTEDGRGVRIEIRPGVRFHDGSALDAGDVARSLRRLRASEAGWLVAAIDRVEHRGREVTVRLAPPAATPAAIRALAMALSAPMAAITPDGEPPARGAIGSGPFRLERLDRRRRRVVLSAHEAYMAGRPYLDALTLRWYEGGSRESAAYEVGNLALSQRGAVAYPDHRPKYETREAAGPATVLAYVGFGRRGALAHREARRALSLALDRDGLRGIGTGERVVPTLDPVPAAIGGAAAGAGARRPRMGEARRALTQARREDAALAALLARGRERSLEILIDQSRPDDREIAENVAAALFRLGVAARITELPAVAFEARVERGQGDLYIGQMALPAPAPDLALAAAFTAGGDDWATRRLARGALDRAAADRAFEARLPIVPLFHRALRVHHRSDLCGVALDDAARIGFADLFLFGRPTPIPR